MKAAQAKKDAQAALAYMRQWEHEPHRVFGYVWSMMARWSGNPDLPLPCDDRKTAANTVVP